MEGHDSAVNLINGHCPIFRQWPFSSLIDIPACFCFLE